MNSYVVALAATSNSLFAAGPFTKAGGTAANSIAKWDGKNWSKMGSGISDLVYALTVSGNNLFVGGSFTTVGGVAANNIAWWDGSHWSALGSGVNDTVYSLAASEGTLYVGGSFNTAGVTVSADAAEANVGSPNIINGPLSHLLSLGNPAQLDVTAIGSPPLNYQWYFNSNSSYQFTSKTIVPNATNDNLIFDPVIYKEKGNYQVIITNIFGAATSSVAALTVSPQPNVYAFSKGAADSPAVLHLASLPKSTNRLWATTNLSLPIAQWQIITTNVADTSGLFQFIDTNTAGRKTKFYRLSSQ
jgi:hypothetical protein